jgi:hypothetical protein
MNVCRSVYRVAPSLPAFFCFPPLLRSAFNGSRNGLCNYSYSRQESQLLLFVTVTRQKVKNNAQPVFPLLWSAQNFSWNKTAFGTVFFQFFQLLNLINHKQRCGSIESAWSSRRRTAAGSVPVSARRRQLPGSTSRSRRSSRSRGGPARSRVRLRACSLPKTLRVGVAFCRRRPATRCAWRRASSPPPASSPHCHRPSGYPLPQSSF